MIKSILKIFTHKKKIKQSKKITHPIKSKDQFIKSLEDFENRPIHKNLTAAMIDAIADDELLQFVFDNLILKLPKEPTNEFQTVLGWTKSQQAIFITWCLEAEVNNGGFNQFYYNPAGQYAGLVSEAMTLLGAIEFADLTKRAHEVYINEQEKINKYQNGSLAGFSKSYEDNPLNKFDDEFYELNKNDDLQKLQIGFIRKHKEDFVES